jgi:FdhE protein
MSAARQTWLAAHPWLAPIARFEAVVQEAALRVDPPSLEPARRAAGEDAAGAGVPLLMFGSTGRITSAAAYVLGQVAERTAQTYPPGDLADAFEEVRDELRRDPRQRVRVIEWLALGAPAPDAARTHPGLLRFLGWTALSRVLDPLSRGRAADEERWGHGSCPTCGSLPLLAHLARAQGASSSTRFLACACCRTRWRYPRIGCPFCASDSPERLHVLELEDGAPLRIDACDRCKGYLKTYVGEGDEDLFLTDWATLHLDLLARNRGYRRLGASLYELPDGERGISA